MYIIVAAAMIITPTIMPLRIHQLLLPLGIGVGAGAAVVGGVVVFVSAGATVVLGAGACVGAA
jgi:hypothetical protein